MVKIKLVRKWTLNYTEHCTCTRKKNPTSPHSPSSSSNSSRSQRCRQEESPSSNSLDPSDLLAQAARLDHHIIADKDVGPLAGVLVAVKDNIYIANMLSTGGSRILVGYRLPFDATTMKRVKELGTIVVGKTNLDEFGMGSSVEGFKSEVELKVWPLRILLDGIFGGGLEWKMKRESTERI